MSKHEKPLAPESSEPAAETESSSEDSSSSSTSSSSGSRSSSSSSSSDSTNEGPRCEYEPSEMALGFFNVSSIMDNVPEIAKTAIKMVPAGKMVFSFLASVGEEKKSDDAKPAEEPVVAKPLKPETPVVETPVVPVAEKAAVPTEEAPQSADPPPADAAA